MTLPPRRWITILCLAAAALPRPAAAQAQDSNRGIDTQGLSLDPAWLALVEYQPDRLDGGWHSQADKAGFFLSPSGRADPRAELEATVAALFGANAQRSGDAATRCRFPARYTWLRERLGVEPETDLLAQCPALRAWYAPLAAPAAAIDFASSYLENPSSTFGHTFLRFQTPDTPPLLTPTVNYAADSSRQEGKLGFIVKGLVGGFPGVADELPYFRRLRSYGDDEGRDIWEYPLRLDPAQIRLLLYGLWEVKDGVFDYYFLDENCSYRTLALIAAVRPEQGLLRPFWLDVVPVETVKVLRRHDLIGEPVYWPSAPRTLYWHTRGFSAQQLSLTIALARGRIAPRDLPPMPEAERAQLLRAAAEYSSILINRGKLDLETRERVTQGLIQARLDQDQPAPADPVPVPPRPDEGHGGKLLAAGWVDRQGVNAVELAIAGFQHELTDPLPGYQAGAAVTVLGARYRFGEGGGLEQLDLLRVESKTPSTRLFQQAAWSLQLGAERKYLGTQRPLLGTLGYSSGRAVDLGGGVLSLTLGASLDGAQDLRAGLGLEGRYRLDLTRQSAAFNYQLYFEQGRYLLGQSSLRHDYGLDLSVPLFRELSLELDLRRAGSLRTENQLRLELRRFF